VVNDRFPEKTVSSVRCISPMQREHIVQGSADCVEVCAPVAVWTKPSAAGDCKKLKKRLNCKGAGSQGRDKSAVKSFRFP